GAGGGRGMQNVVRTMAKYHDLFIDTMMQEELWLHPPDETEADLFKEGSDELAACMMGDEPLVSDSSAGFVFLWREREQRLPCSRPSSCSAQCRCSVTASSRRFSRRLQLMSCLLLPVWSQPSRCSSSVPSRCVELASKSPVKCFLGSLNWRLFPESI